MIQTYKSVTFQPDGAWRASRHVVNVWKPAKSQNARGCMGMREERWILVLLYSTKGMSRFVRRIYS